MTNLLSELPTPPPNKTGFPWTEATPPQYFDQNLPKITIVTPSFNQGEFIEETIRSVILQNYPNLEYIIIDGGSTDNTVEIIKKYEKWITYWVSEPDEGQSDAINKGLKMATGDVFNWLNSDDGYLPSALCVVGSVFRSNPECHVLSGREKRYRYDGVNWYVHGCDLYDTVEKTIAFARVTNLPTFFKTEVLRDIGYLRKEFHLSMDTEWWVRYLTKYGQSRVKQIENIIDTFRIHPRGKSSNFSFLSHQDRFCTTVGVIRGLKSVKFPQRLTYHNPFTIGKDICYELHPSINEKILAAYLAEHLLNLFSQYLSYLDCINLFLFSLYIKPFGRSKHFYLFLFVKVKRFFYPI